MCAGFDALKRKVRGAPTQANARRSARLFAVLPARRYTRRCALFAVLPARRYTRRCALFAVLPARRYTRRCARRAASRARRCLVVPSGSDVRRRPRERLPSAVGDATARQVIRGELDRDLVPRQDTDEVLPHLARDMGEHLVAIGQLNAEHRVPQRLDYRPLDDETFFLRHEHSAAQGARLQLHHRGGPWRTSSRSPLTKLHRWAAQAEAARILRATAWNATTSDDCHRQALRRAASGTRRHNPHSTSPRPRRSVDPAAEHHPHAGDKLACSTRADSLPWRRPGPGDVSCALCKSVDSQRPVSSASR